MQWLGQMAVEEPELWWYQTWPLQPLVWCTSFSEIIHQASNLNLTPQPLGWFRYSRRRHDAFHEVIGCVPFQHAHLHPWCAIRGFLFQICRSFCVLWSPSFMCSIIHRHALVWLSPKIYSYLSHSFVVLTYGTKCTFCKIKAAFYLKVLEQTLLKNTVFYMNSRTCKTCFSHTCLVLSKITTILIFV